MNMKSAICVVALVAAIAFVCEAKEKLTDPLLELNEIMEKANDTDGHSLIAAWENQYKNSNPENESDKLVKDALQKFVKFFQFNPDAGCKEEDVDVLNDARDLVREHDLFRDQRIHENLIGAFRYKEANYELACREIIYAHWTV